MTKIVRAASRRPPPSSSREARRLRGGVSSQHGHRHLHPLSLPRVRHPPRDGALRRRAFRARLQRIRRRRATDPPPSRRAAAGQRRLHAGSDPPRFRLSPTRHIAATAGDDVRQHAPAAVSPAGNERQRRRARQVADEHRSRRRRAPDANSRPACSSCRSSEMDANTACTRESSHSRFRRWTPRGRSAASRANGAPRDTGASIGHEQPSAWFRDFARDSRR